MQESSTEVIVKGSITTRGGKKIILRMADKRAEEVDDVVGMYNIGALGLTGGLGGIGP